MTELTLLNSVEMYKNSSLIGDQARKELRDKAIAALGEFLYLHLKHFKLHYLSEDIRSDFIVALYPRFGNIIDQFDADRASFGTYIRTIVRLSYRTFTKNRYGYEARQKVYETEEATRLIFSETDCMNSLPFTEAVIEEEIGYLVNKALLQAHFFTKKKKEIHARKIFLMACKTGNMLDEKSIEQISRMCGYSVEYIRSNLERLSEECKKKDEKMRVTAENRNKFYIRSQRCLYEMKYLEKDTARYIALEKEYQYCLKRWKNIRFRSARQMRTPSNRFLSTVLGISRCTIDATLASPLETGYSRLS